MSTNGRPAPSPSGPGTQNRLGDAQRHARALRDDAAGRRRLLRRGGVGAGLLVAAAVIAIVIGGALRPATAGPLNMASDGVLLGADDTGVIAATTVALTADEDPIPTDPDSLANLVNITMYVDYLCPYCSQFNATNAAQITSWITAGNATVEIHPISIMDSASAGTSYSTRAANAAACVADSSPNAFLAVNTALLDAASAEQTAGLTDAELLTVLASAGVQNDAVTECVTDQTFTPWVDAATDRALSGPLPNSDVTAVTGAPTVLVNGVSYHGVFDDAEAFEAFVLAQAADLDDDELALAEAQAAAAAAAAEAALTDGTE